MQHGVLPDTQDRTTWHKSENGCWSISLGRRGCRVRVTQREPGAEFFCVTWLPSQGKRLQSSLRTTSRTEAKNRAEDFLRALLKEEALGDAPLTVEDLWNRYQKEAPGYQSNSERTRESKRKYAELLLVGFGRRKLVKDLTLDDVERYKQRRRTGKGWPDGRTTRSVRVSAVQRDLQLLRAMIRWALTVKVNGRWLLKENPLRGLKLPREENPNRAISDYDRYLATREAMRKLAVEAPQKRGRLKWIRLELALYLAEATGRRIGSIRGLRWSDIDFTKPSIWWNPEFDKRGREVTVPIPAEMANELKQFRAKLEAFGDDWLFPAADGREPWDRELFTQGLARAERLAKLPKLRGSLWHALRRKWAIEHKNEPLSDVMAVGGWKDPKTLLTCYQLADERTMLRVMSVPQKLRAANSGK